MLPNSREGLHRHHIIPRHMGGEDDSINIVFLTPEEHAEEHRKLWESNGNQEDYIAYRSLLGLMGKEEATNLSIINSNKTRVVSEETRRKIGERSRGRQSKLGYNTSDETKKKIRETLNQSLIKNDIHKDRRIHYNIVLPSGKSVMTENLKHFCDCNPDAPAYGSMRQQLHRGRNKWTTGQYKGFEVYNLTN